MLLMKAKLGVYDVCNCYLVTHTHRDTNPEYSSTDIAWIQEHTNLQKGEDGWYRDSDGYLILPAQLG